MVNAGEALRATIARMRERAESPEYQQRLQELAEQDAAAAEVRAAEVRRAVLRDTGIPRATWALLEAPREEPAILAARRFLANPRCLFLTLAGPRGRGKTSAAAWACYQRRGRFVDAHDLVRAGTFDRALWTALEQAPLLALDELGTEHANDSFRADLFGLLNKRQGNLRQTIIATNLDAAAFKARYLSGPLERLEDRLRAHGEWVNLPGESMRQAWKVGAP